MRAAAEGVESSNEFAGDFDIHVCRVQVVEDSIGLRHTALVGVYACWLLANVEEIFDVWVIEEGGIDDIAELTGEVGAESASEL